MEFIPGWRLWYAFWGKRGASINLFETERKLEQTNLAIRMAIKSMIKSMTARTQTIFQQGSSLNRSKNLDSSWQSDVNLRMEGSSWYGET